MDSVVELTYHQLMHRLHFLSLRYSNFKLCANCGAEYNPVDILCRARFKFDDKTYLCYKTVLDCELHSGINCHTEFYNLELISESFFDEPVIIVANTNKTYSVCGIYVDEDNKKLVLLNGYHNGEPVNWSKLEGDIY